MQEATPPPNEQDRLRNLYSYELLDTLPEKDYDDITKLASQICNTSISLVTLVDKDRQWFKSAHGTTLEQTEREYAFCSHTILQPHELMIIEDAANDSRFSDNPLVTGDLHIAFYAGVSLVSEEGFPIGSLCVLDQEPKALNISQQQALQTLASQTMRLIQLHKKTKELERSRKLLQEVNQELEKFAGIVAANLKIPCENAIEITNLISEKYADQLDADGKQMVSLVKYSCENIKATVDKTLQQANTIGMLQDNKSLFTFTSLMQELKHLFPLAAGNVLLNSLPGNSNIYYYKNLLIQILQGIIEASLSFNDKQDPLLEITFRSTRDHYQFVVSDNGKGTPVFSRNGGFMVLQSATVSSEADVHYTTHLNTVKHLIVALSGSLDLQFEEHTKTVFTITLPK